MMCSGCRKVDKSCCYPCGAIRITEAEIAAAVAKERERAKPVIETADDLLYLLFKHFDPECANTISDPTLSEYAEKLKSALKNYEEGK